MDSGTDNFRQESAKVCLIFMSDRQWAAFRLLSIFRGPESGRKKEVQRGTPWNVASEEGVLCHLPLSCLNLALQRVPQGFTWNQSRVIHLSPSSRALGLSGHSGRWLGS